MPEPAKGDGSIPIPIADNDAIAAVLAVQLKCDLLLLLSNVPGVCPGAPASPSCPLPRWACSFWGYCVKPPLWPQWVVSGQRQASNSAQCVSPSPENPFSPLPTGWGGGRAVHMGWEFFFP